MITRTYEFEEKPKHDIIVAGGGVAGVAAAVSASREGKSVLLIEKLTMLGGLATAGLISLFVPMCNGEGVQIVKGMADEFLRKATEFGYDDIPAMWKDGSVTEAEKKKRLHSHVDVGSFVLVLNKMLSDAGVDILYDTVICDAVTEGNICRGLIVENKSGMAYYPADVIVDTTGDCDVLHRAGVPCRQGKNYFTSVMHTITLESCQKAVGEKNIGKAIKWWNGGPASLYGARHPEDRPYYSGTDGDENSAFIRDNQLLAYAKYKDDNRFERAIVNMPSMAQFRTVRHIIGDYTLTREDVFRHFDDSVTAICDMDRRGYLYEIPYRTLCSKKYPNLITAGRCLSADGYAWDVARVIPPAIVTGQAAGIASAMALESGCAIADIDIKVLQQKLSGQNVMIHFDDSLIPADIAPYPEGIDHADAPFTQPKPAAADTPKPDGIEGKLNNNNNNNQ